MSHDFRGPLQNAGNYLELIRRDADPAQRAHFAGRAASNLRRVDSMIGRLLDVTRTNAGARLSLRIESFEAVTLAREVIADLAMRSGDRLELHADSAVTGYWDGDRLRQALENLLTNAIKYGRPDTAITACVTGTHGRLLISVHNEGDPIPAEVFGVMFQPFRRSLSAERSDQDGWGLGLVLVQAIAEAHGGSVAVDSSVERGTTFTLDILLDCRQFARPEPVSAVALPAG